jgi:hypothetical protein
MTATTETETIAQELRDAAKTLRESGPIFAKEATGPLAEWLETEAYMVEKRGLSPEGQTFHALKAARAINGRAA